MLLPDVPTSFLLPNSCFHSLCFSCPNESISMTFTLTQNLPTLQNANILRPSFMKPCWVKKSLKRAFTFKNTLRTTFGEGNGNPLQYSCLVNPMEESNATEQLHFHFSLSFIGEGNGNPLQCSCLKNHRDSGDWWAAIYGVAQSRTQLKWLSSSNSKDNITLLIF